MGKVRIVLADDHVLVREGTRRILEQEPEEFAVVGEAGTGAEALDLIEHLKPDVAILDIRMPRLTGVEVVRRMRELSSSTRALMLTGYDDDEYILALMEAGAVGYLLKTARGSELIEAVRSVCANEPILDPAIAVKVARLWGRGRTTSPSEAAGRLSVRELEVLSLAARGLRNREIAARLVISVRTVEAHVSSILTKLHLASRIEAILWAISRNQVNVDVERQP
jgi:two-component system, NarL family, response regulator LiaR